MEGVGALAGMESRARAPARRINLLPPPFAPSADAVAMIASMGFAEQVRISPLLPVVWPKNKAIRSMSLKSAQLRSPTPLTREGSRNPRLNIEKLFFLSTQSSALPLLRVAGRRLSDALIDRCVFRFARLTTLARLGAQHARAALVAVGSNSVEMAMEWLLTHPQEEVAGPDSELAAAMSLSLTTDEGGGGGEGGGGAEGRGGGAVGGGSGPGAGEAELEATRMAAATALAAKVEDSVCPKVEAPPADEMVHTTLMLACAAATEGALLPLTDLLVALCKRSGGEDRARVVSAVMHKLCATVRSEATASAAAAHAASEAERHAAVKTVAHVLVLMLMKEPGTRAAAADAGLSSTVMDLLQPLVAQVAAQVCPCCPLPICSTPPLPQSASLPLSSSLSRS